MLYGPSGCGKSSVLRAGVAYALRRQAEANLDEGREPEHAVVVFDRWSDDPAEGDRRRRRRGDHAAGGRPA